MFNWYFSVNALPYWVILLVDSLICYLSGIFVFWLFYRGAVTVGNIELLSRTIFVYMIFNLVGFRVFRTYSGIIRYSSFIDLRRVFFAMLLSLGIAEVMHYFMYNWHVEGLDFVRMQGKQILAMYLVAMVGMMLFRVLVKSFYDRMFSTDAGLRTLVYGLNTGGIGMAKQIRDEKPRRFRLKGFISHDNTMKGRVLMGEKVFIVNEKLAGFLKELRIQAVIVSPLQNERFRNDTVLQDILIEAGIKIYMNPETREWTQDDDYSHVGIKEISVEDLLPRDQIHVDMDAIGTLLRGKSIMITGSAGSIGSEMVRQIAIYNPAELVLIDQAETPQHDIRLMMHFHWPNIKAETIVTNITNKERMEKIFAEYRPDYVFHAAA